MYAKSFPRMSDNCQAAAGYCTEGVFPERFPGFVFYKPVFYSRISSSSQSEGGAQQLLSWVREVAAQQLGERSLLASGRKEKVMSRFMLEGSDSSLSHLMCFFISHLDKSARVDGWIWSAMVSPEAVAIKEMYFYN